MGLATTAQLPGEVGTVCPEDFERAQMTTFKHLEKSFLHGPLVSYTLYSNFLDFYLMSFFPHPKATLYLIIVSA